MVKNKIPAYIQAFFSNSLLRSSTIYVVLGMLPMAVNFLLAPVYSKYLPPEENGLVSIAAILQAVLIILIGMSLEGAFMRFYFYYFKKPRLIRALLSTTLLVVLIVGSGYGLLLNWAGEAMLDLVFKSDEFSFSRYGMYVYGSALATIVHAIFLIYYRNREEPFRYGLFSLAFFFCSVAGILIGIVGFEAGAFGSIAGRMAGNLVVPTGMVIFFFVRNGLRFKLSWAKKMLLYSLPIALYQLIMAAFSNVDRYMVEQYFDLEVLGRYHFAYLFASVIAVLISSFANAFFPRIYKLLSEDEMLHGQRVRQLVSLIHLALLGMVALSIAFAVPLVKIFLDEAYHEISLYIGLLFMAYVPRIYYVIFSFPLFYYKNTRVLPVISFLALAAGVASNLLLIPILGILGVCISVFLTLMVQFIATWIYLVRLGYTQKPYLHLRMNHLVAASMVITYFGAFALSYLGGGEGMSLVWVNLVPLLVYAALGLPLLYREIFGKKLRLFS